MGGGDRHRSWQDPGQGTGPGRCYDKSHEGDKQQASGKDKMDEEEGYGKIYTKTHEKRAERSLSRSERREQEEERKRQEAA